MAKADSSNQQKTVDFSEGISAGLKYWLFFLACFLLLRYPVRLSILLGIAGGVAGGWIVAWWKTKEQPKNQQQVDVAKGSTPSLAGAEILTKPKDTKTKSDRQRRGILNSLGLVGRKDRSLKSRRKPKV